MIIAFVGSGGKTSLLKEYAKKYLKQKKTVFVTTSTHMYIEEYTLISDDADEIIERLKKDNFVMAGIKDGCKITALSKETYEKVCRHADVVLIEADGSKQLPLKFPAEGEPVIYDNVDEIIVVAGVFALNKKTKDVCHRLELVKECLKISDDEPVKAWHIQKLLKKGYIETLQNKYPDKKINIHLNNDNSLYQRVVSSLIEADMDVSLIKEEWFTPQPKLIICGGGHVSMELVKMASCLDFSIKVIDDREEFANPKRFPLAQEVICDSFENFGDYVEPDAYYIIVTRGHKDDYLCVKRILEESYQYLGMIGSKRKVAETFQKLKNNGISEEKIDTIHAPIGLDIGAVTPAEIAISILAEVIKEKNKTHTASVSRELLDNKEHGMLCIIIDKHGSSPRGVGSMMFVNDTMTIDSIRGGAVELAAIKEARENNKAMIKEYELNHKDRDKLGMICGGYNKVLFIPV
mgnify:CR=1 FL=1